MQLLCWKLHRFPTFPFSHFLSFVFYLLVWISFVLSTLIISFSPLCASTFHLVFSSLSLSFTLFQSFSVNLSHSHSLFTLGHLILYLFLPLWSLWCVNIIFYHSDPVSKIENLSSFFHFFYLSFPGLPLPLFLLLLILLLPLLQPRIFTLYFLYSPSPPKSSVLSFSHYVIALVSTSIHPLLVLTTLCGVILLLGRGNLWFPRLEVNLGIKHF